MHVAVERTMQVSVSKNGHLKVTVEGSAMTVPLTRTLFDLIESVGDWGPIQEIVKKGDDVLGWVSGSVTNDTGCWIIFKQGDRYKRFLAPSRTVKDRFPHIYTPVESWLSPA